MSSPRTAVAVKQPISTALALPPELAAELAAEAKDAAAKERPQVSRISLKSGVMSYGGQAIPGNKLECVIVGGAHRNVFYAGRYDANNIVNPNCFALGEDEDGLVPHENVDSPVASACAKCPNMEWGSDPNGGRGKACKQQRRLLVMPADATASAEAVLKAELAILDLPVTSVRNYSNFVNTVSASVKAPVWAVVCVISVSPNAKTQFQVDFTPISVIPDADVLQAVRARKDEAMRIALTPFAGTGGEADPGAAAPAAPKAPLKKKF